jgi:microcystin-dependent protein
MNLAKSKASDACIHISAIFVRYICTLSICFWSVVAKAESPAPFDGMSFQSYILDSDKQPITGTKTIKFSIYDAEQSGNLQWAETQHVHVNAGNFSVILGQGAWSPVPDHSSRRDLGDVFEGGTRFIEITVNSNVLTPRLKLLPSAYSFRALTADKLSFNTNPILEVDDTGTTAHGTLSVTGASTLSGTLSVTGASTLSGALSVTEDLTVGTTTASKKATVHGNIETTGQFIGYGTVPLGGIIMWSGLVVPDGWAVCDGQKVTGSDGDIFTPDLSGRFIVGAVLDDNLTGPGSDKSKPLNHSGGHDKVTLETENLPPHQHSGTTNKDGAHQHTGVAGLSSGGRTQGGKAKGTHVSTNGGGTVHGSGSDHQHAFTTDNNFNSTMKSTPFSIVPKYYALAYIMRIQ